MAAEEQGRYRLVIERTWDGRSARPGERACLELWRDGPRLAVGVDAPSHGDPPPPSPPGSTARLWEHEVVELFLLGRSGAYFELELGPHGHYLALQLAARRRVVASGLPLSYRVLHGDGRWRGEASLPLGYLPPGVERGNAYAMHGRGALRRHLALYPTGGEQPDFHRLRSYGRLPLDFGLR